MSHSLTVGPFAMLLGLSIAGFALGLLYFEALRRTIERFAQGAGWLEPVALTVGRIGVAACILFVAARVDATALLSTFVGFMLARTLAIHRSRKAG
ncbi:MAG TPA: ATP synthase subunit I [Steroidobacteraceae bacterium]|nr:ATP synthase subunit I [Steroidobacteraceae bacterium]